MLRRAFATLTFTGVALGCNGTAATAGPSDPDPGTGSLRVTLVDAERRPIEGLTDHLYAELYELAASGERLFWLPLDGPALDLPHV